MRTNSKKRFLAWMIAFLMVFTYVPATAFAAEEAVPATEAEVVADDVAVAATVAELTVLDGQIKITNDLATGSIADGVVTLTAAGGPLTTYQTNTVTITNNTAKMAVMQFDYVLENYKDTDGYTGLADDNGTYNAVVAAGESVVITFAGKRANNPGNAVLTLSGFSLEAVADTSAITLNYDSNLGSVTVAGAATDSGTVKTTTYADGLELAAAAKSGAEFLGWINEATGKILSRDAAFTFNPTADMTVKAVFAGEASEGHYLAGESFIFTDLDEATAKAATLTKKVVTLMNDVTLTGTNTIPAGVTLLVPFDKEGTLYTTNPVGEHGNYTTPVAYRTLTLADGAELIVNGAVSLSAKHNAASSNTRGSGAPMGNVSFMELGKDAAVTIKDGGALYAYGFVTGKGTVTAESGATVYENFQIEDFRGGSATTFMAVNNVAKGVLPIAQYYVQNIEVPLTLEAGATEYCYTSLYLSSSALGSSVKFISDSGAMFILEDGYVTKSYDGAADRLVVEGNGNMSLSPIKVELEGQGIDSAAFDLPINNNISVDINSGNVVIKQDVALLPGAEINIAEGATCTLGEGVSVYVYDLDQWGAYCGASNEAVLPVNYAPGKTYNRTAADLVDAAVKVNGLLDASKGYLYTTTSSDYSNGNANIYSTGNGAVMTVSGEQECTYQFKQNGTEGTFDEIYLLPANLHNEDGSYLQTLSADVTTYIYENGVWAEGELHVHAYKEVVTAATCTTAGYTTFTCECGDTYKGNDVAALGHNYVDHAAKDATCTAVGWEAYQTCSRCDYTTYKEIDIKEHTYTAVVAAPTCTEKGYTTFTCTCGDTYKGDETAALGHEYNAVVTAPTCTAEGYTTYTCIRCKDSYQDDVVKATGHSYGAWKTVKAATCTAKGSEERVCHCGDKETRETAALGHAYTAVVTAPTCTADGYTTYTCSKCGNSYKDDVVKATGHSYGAWTTSVAPTCTAAGTQVRSCACGHQETQSVAALGHTWETEYTVDKTATTGRAGSKSYHCAVCDAINTASVTKIVRIKQTTAATVEFNGKIRNGNVTVVDFNGKKLVKGRDFTVVYKNGKATKVVTPKAIGNYTAVVTFKGDYSGTVSKKFSITPKATVVTKLTKPAKKQIKVTWQKRTVQVTGYQVRVSLKQNMANPRMVTVKGFKKNTTTIKNLKAKKKYWVQVRTYKTVNGVKIFSAWSAKRTIVTK